MNVDQLANCGAGIFLTMIALIATFAAVCLLLGVFWVWMLVDCANSPLPSGDKTAWILIILFTHILGATLYYFIPRRERLRVPPPSRVAPPSSGAT